MKIEFETWKREFVPRVYEDAECDEHAPDFCACEFLYTFDETDTDERDEVATAENERRIWAWHGNGAIVSGRAAGAEILITEKPYTEETEII